MKHNTTVGLVFSGLLSFATTPADAAQKIDYFYDPVGRLTAATYDDTLSVHYEYDPNGNLTHVYIGDVIVDVDEPDTMPGRPTVFTLAPVAPNPMRGAATLRYALPRTSDVRLDIFDASGRRVRTLVQGDRPAGHHVTHWDGRSQNGHRVAEGMYFVRFVARGGVQETTRLIVLR